MSPVDKRLEIIPLGGARNIQIRAINEDVWQCRETVPASCSTLFMLSFWGLGLFFGVFWVGLGILAMWNGQAGVVALVFGVIFLALGGGFGLATFSALKSVRTVLIDRKTATLTIWSKKGIGAKRSARYRLREFTSLAIRAKVVRSGRHSSTFVMGAFEGNSNACEIFRTSWDDRPAVRLHGRKIADFLALPLIDYTRPYAIADVLHVLHLDKGLHSFLSHYTDRLDDVKHAYAGPKIPATLLNNAVKQYATGYSHDVYEEPLLLIDTTWNQSGKSGLLLTSTHLYTPDPITGQPLKIALADLYDFRIFSRNAIYADAEKLLALTLSASSTLALAQLLKVMAFQASGRLEQFDEIIEMFQESCAVHVAFGKFHVSPEDGAILLRDHDFARRTKPLPIVALYLEPDTCDAFLVEKFITYIVNYPPQMGISNIRVMYLGNLEALGAHVMNAVRNTFPQITRRA